MTFAVVVKTSPKDIASCHELVDRNGNEIDLMRQFELDFHLPVFNVGEILILNDSGREVCYPGRKPSKWRVQVEEFTDLNEAIARSKQVFDDFILEERSKMDIPPEKP